METMKLGPDYLNGSDLSLPKEYYHDLIKSYLNIKVIFSDDIKKIKMILIMLIMHILLKIQLLMIFNL